MSGLFLNSPSDNATRQYGLALKNWTIPLFFGLIMFFLQVMIYLGGIQLKPGEFADTDCYMRMIRVEKLVQERQWYDQTFERSNAPLGETSHWGRLMDVLIIALSLPFALFMPEKRALLFSGILISPVLLVFSGFAMAWAARPFFRKLELPHFLLLFFSQASVVLFFQAGRPDHHSLLLLLFILGMGFLFRLLQSGSSPRVALGCALAQALAFAVSLESITVIVMTLALLATAWITGKFRAKQGLRFSGALLVFSFLFYLSEQGWSKFNIIELDRMSPPHLAALAIAFFYWVVLRLGEGRFFTSTATRRSLLTVFFGVAAAVLLFHLFPDLQRGPYGQMDVRLNDLWLKHVLEVQPIWQTDPGGLTPLFIWLSPALLLLPALAYLLLRRRLPEDYKTWSWAAAMVSSLFFLLLTLYQIRWASYAQTSLIFPFCALLGEILQVTEKRLSPPFFKWARLGILFFFCAGYVPIALLSLGPKLLEASRQNTALEHPVEKASLAQLTQWMGNEPQLQGKERILAHLDLGPELLFRTPHEVVATPYHRNGSGILFFYDLMNENSDGKVRQMLAGRGITLILLQPESSEQAFLNQSGLTDSFYRRLVDGKIPAFLRTIELPEKSRGSFRLYRVIPAG